MSQLDLFARSDDPPAHKLKALLIEHEFALWKKGFTHIAGVDEVGRGPLAGPVVACACILPKGLHFPGVQDSKTLTPKERKRISDFLTTHPDIIWAIGQESAEIIDKINILRATLSAMKKALEALSRKPDYILVDGRDLPPIDLAGRAVIHGDAQSQSIGAASIIAKVYRDELMEKEYHPKYPLYGFDKHKGYGTEAHKEAIEKYGNSPIHRLSFTSVKQQALYDTPTLF